MKDLDFLEYDRTMLINAERIKSFKTYQKEWGKSEHVTVIETRIEEQKKRATQTNLTTPSNDYAFLINEILDPLNQTIIKIWNDMQQPFQEDTIISEESISDIKNDTQDLMFENKRAFLTCLFKLRKSMQKDLEKISPEYYLTTPLVGLNYLKVAESTRIMVQTLMNNEKNDLEKIGATIDAWLRDCKNLSSSQGDVWDAIVLFTKTMAYTIAFGLFFGMIGACAGAALGGGIGSIPASILGFIVGVTFGVMMGMTIEITKTLNEIHEDHIKSYTLEISGGSNDRSCSFLRSPFSFFTGLSPVVDAKELKTVEETARKLVS